MEPSETHQLQQRRRNCDADPSNHRATTQQRRQLRPRAANAIKRIGSAPQSALQSHVAAAGSADTEATGARGRQRVRSLCGRHQSPLNRVKFEHLRVCMRA
eukprot:354831-Chlamydomonas_euryale.AAC.2